MPARKTDGDGGEPKTLIPGFEDRETKMIAAAYLSAIGIDKYNYEKMAELSGYTTGSVKKMWPPVKRKMMETNPSFAQFISNSSHGSGVSPAGPGSKNNTPKKRKVQDVKAVDVTTEASDGNIENGTESNGKANDQTGRKLATSTSTIADQEDPVTPKKKVVISKSKPATKKPKIDTTAETTDDAAVDENEVTQADDANA